MAASSAFGSDVRMSLGAVPQPARIYQTDGTLGETKQMGLSVNVLLQRYFYVDEVKAALSDIGESSSGNKPQLVNRLVASWSAPVAAMAGRAATSGAAHRASPTTPHRATRPLFIAFRRFVAPLIESIAAPRPQPAPADRGAGSRSADATFALTGAMMRRALRRPLPRRAEIAPSPVRRDRPDGEAAPAGARVRRPLALHQGADAVVFRQRRQGLLPRLLLAASTAT